VADFSSINEVIIGGRVGKISDLYQGKEPRCVKFCYISIATTEIFKGGKKKTYWHRFTLWGKTAEWACEYINVGDFVSITGKLHYRFFRDDEGKNHKITDVTAEKLTIIYFKRQAEEEEALGPKETKEDDDEKESF